MPFDVTRAYDEATQYRRPAHLDGRARHRDVEDARRLNAMHGSHGCGGDGRLSRRSTSTYRALARPGRRRRRRATRWSSSAPARSGLSAGDRPGAARRAACVLLDNDNTLSTGSRAICFAKRTLEIFDRLGCGDAHGRQGRVVERRQGVLRRRAGLPASTCCPRPATSGRPSSTCSSTTSRATWRSARRELPLIDLRWKQQGGRRRAARRPRAADRSRRPTGRYRLRGRLGRRLRRLALDAARSCSARRARAASSTTAS